MSVSIFLPMSADSRINKLNAWRRDIQGDIDGDTDGTFWNEACLKAQKQTINTQFNLLQYKWVIRMYLTPVKLQDMSGNGPDICTKCLYEKGTVLHCL